MGALEAGAEENPLLKDTTGHGRVGSWSPALNQANSKHQRLKAELNRHRHMVLGLVCCVCLLLIIIVGLVVAALVPHFNHHHGRKDREKMKVLQEQEAARTKGQSIDREMPGVLHFQDDLCRTVSPIEAQLCSAKGGICVSGKEDCNGIVKGTCGRECGCCFSGCPAEWRGDGECDFECNTEQYGWDGNDCKGNTPVFSECPDAWKGDGECDDLCNNQRNDFDGHDCDAFNRNSTGGNEESFSSPNRLGPLGDIASSLVAAFACPMDWRGDGECDSVCDTERYGHDCSPTTQQCDCEGGPPPPSTAPPPPDRGTCQAPSAQQVQADPTLDDARERCHNNGGTCVGKGGTCDGVIRGQCGPDCYCCVGETCGKQYRGDGICDPQCNKFCSTSQPEKCDCDQEDPDHCYAKNDCKGGPVGSALNFNNVNCPEEWQNDGECDAECSNPQNQWDGGDCEDQMPADFCPSQWKGDGECDAVCNIERYDYDCDGAECDCGCRDNSPLCVVRVRSGEWDCDQMLCPTCSQAKLCDKTCGISCEGARAPLPPPALPPPLPGIPEQPHCPAARTSPSPLTAHCINTGGFCSASKGECGPGMARGACGSNCACCYRTQELRCQPQFLGDGQCDPPCNTAAYHYDGRQDAEGVWRSDCKGNEDEVEYMQCPSTWINDGECDEECNNPENDYDYPDCNGRILELTLFGNTIRQTVCPEEWIGDGECDQVCNNEANHYDMNPRTGDYDPGCGPGTSDASSSTPPPNAENDYVQVANVEAQLPAPSGPPAPTPVSSSIFPGGVGGSG